MRLRARLMVRVVAARMLAFPVEAVFDSASDPDRQLVWDADELRAVEKLTPGPLGRGTRIRASTKSMGQVVYEYAEFDRPRRFSHRAEMRLGRSEHVFTLEPLDGGTRVIQEGSLEPKGVWRLMAPIMRRMLSKRLAKVGDELDRYLRTNNAESVQG